MLSSGSRNRVPTSSDRAYPRHTLRFAGQSMTIAPHVHPQRCWPCVFSCLLSHLCFLSASRPSHDRVSGACAAAVAEFSVAALNFFLRLRRACHWLLLSPAAGLGARFFGAAFSGGILLLHESSRPARRTAKAWRLRPARGTAPRVSGSRQSVLHEGQGNAAAAVTTAAAAALHS